MHCRSVNPKNIPEHLNLEAIDTKEKISPKQLKHLVGNCPNLKNVKFKYLPDDRDLRELSAVRKPSPTSIARILDMENGINIDDVDEAVMLVDNGEHIAVANSIL